MAVTLVRTIDRLPMEFAALEADAKADGHAHLTRLSGEFAEDPAMFHAIFAAYVDGELAGIGAMTDEPTMTSHPTWRMRRLYVPRRFRRQKIAYAIATALLQEAAKKVGVVTVHAGSDEAARFWEALDFAASPAAAGRMKEQYRAQLHACDVRIRHSMREIVSEGTSLTGRCPSCRLPNERSRPWHPIGGSK